MPYYEFYCPTCHTVFNFFSRRVNTTTRPSCPRCERPALKRLASMFAISTGRTEDADGLPGFDEAQTERLLAELERDMGGADAEDPKVAAAAMRQLFGKMGMALPEGMQEALGRMAAGEDPQAIEAELGDALEAEEDIGIKPKPGRRDIRRMLPPRVDPGIYDL